MLLASIIYYWPDTLLALYHQDVKMTLLLDPAFNKTLAGCGAQTLKN
jgi:hypothetical protein